MNFSVRTIFSPLLPVIEDEFFISHAKAASLFVYNSVGYSISLFLSGVFSGSFGYRRSIVISMLASGLIFFLMPFVDVFASLCILVFFLGLANGVYLPAIIPIITDYFVEKVWGKTIAIHDSAASISIFAVPFIAVLLLDFISWRNIFVLFGAIFFVCAIFFAFTCKEIRVPKSDYGRLSEVLRSGPLWLMGVMWIFASGANLGVYFVVPLYLTKELFLDIRYANEIFAVSRIGGVMLAIAAGFVVDKFSLKKILFLQLFITGALTILLTYADTRHIGLALFFQASVAMVFFPVGLVAISRMFPQERRSISTGIISTLGVVFGLGAIPYLLGLSGDLLSFRVGIYLLGICTLMSSVLTLFLRVEQVYSRTTGNVEGVVKKQ